MKPENKYKRTPRGKTANKDISANSYVAAAKARASPKENLSISILPFDLVMKIFEIDPWNNKGMILVCRSWRKALKRYKGKLPLRWKKLPVLAGNEIPRFLDPTGSLIWRNAIRFHFEPAYNDYSVFKEKTWAAFSLNNLTAPSITTKFSLDLKEWESIVTGEPCGEPRRRITPIHPLHGKRLTVKRLRRLDGVPARPRRSKNTGRKNKWSR